MASAAKVVVEEADATEGEASPGKSPSGRQAAHDLTSRKSTVAGKSNGESSPKPKRGVKRDATAGTLAARPAVARSPTRLVAEGEVDVAVAKSSPSYLGRSRHAARPWQKEQTTPHPSELEQREPKGWTLSHILSKAKWSMAMSKAFSPHISLNDPNRIKVGVRFRPMSEFEKKRGDSSKEYIKTVGTQVKIVNPRPPPGQEAKAEEYAFDALYTSDDTTSKVFKDLAQPLVHLLVEGFNGTIFAYGQTGSGKTHSMMGNAADPGITPRVTAELFDVLGKISGATYEVRVSYLQIYREVLHDLLGAH